MVGSGMRFVGESTGSLFDGLECEGARGRIQAG
jgi:hypothetical protein